jgi:hypothetical protein
MKVNGEWEMYDPDLSVYYYKRDGTVAGVDDLVADPTLITSPTSPIFTPGANDWRYSDAATAIYSSAVGYQILTYLPTDSYLGNRITLPAGGRLIYPGVWTPAPTAYDDYYTPYEVEQFRQARLELPAGFTGLLPVPWVPWDVQGSGTLRIFGQNFAAGSDELRAFLINPGNAVTEIEVVNNLSGLALIMMINPLWYDMATTNELEFTGINLVSIDAETYPLDPANRPPPPVPTSMQHPRP